MNKEELEVLLDRKPPETRAKGIYLFNGVINAAKKYQEAPTAANLRDWEASEAALQKFAEAQAPPAAPGAPAPALANLTAVLGYLKDEGWKATSSSIHRHHKEGKILPRADGRYDLAAVEKYAKTWLKQQSTGRRVTEQMDELQRKKITLEVKNLELDNKRKELAYEKDLERYIPKELVQIELAGRAGVLEAGLKHMVQSRAAEWIRAVGGDTLHVADLLAIVNADLDEHLNSYAAPIEYRTIFDAVEPEERTVSGDSAPNDSAPEEAAP